MPNLPTAKNLNRKNVKTAAISVVVIAIYANFIHFWAVKIANRLMPNK